MPTRRQLVRGRNICGPLFVLAAAGLVTATCGPALKRDLTKVPVGQVGFDDMCGLQAYFDEFEMKKQVPPRLINSAQVDGETSRGGRSRFAFETEFQLRTVRRVLDENWQRLPPGLTSAKRIDLEVQWSDRGGLRRVVTTEDATLYTDQPAALDGGDGKDRTQDPLGVSQDPKDEFTLPYHVCLSELLFGAPLYHQRRDVLGLAPLPLPQPMTLESNGDGGASDAPAGARADGGADAAARPAR